ncbi:AMP-binding protein [Oceanibacterium hippocampi]|uniref:Long-chain-fatty-acid--CoA ligase n=1 Tax=Oceanibacterium hippocampi TaxID=745714 RepID=A0A1Y5U2E1_9PROT|nr:AMP-binding protein [Oceanibacterium hippocampi]SLN75524.1 Long-chain-fatty-acid--CoA ligase [Oceanibacterium hippocampi]
MEFPTLHDWPGYGDLVRTALARFPERVALVEGDRQLSYRELGQRILAAGSALERLGLRRGEAVAQLSQNSIDAVVLQLAAYARGFRFIPLHPLGAEDDHAYILQDSEARILVFQAGRYSANADYLRSHVEGLSKVLSLSDIFELANDADEESEVVPPNIPEPEHVVTMLYTGGTTGKPKGVVLTNRCMVLNAMLCLSEWEWPADIRFLCATPITHASGCMIVPILLRGGTVYLHAGFDAEKFYEDARRHRITATFLVPTMIYLLLDQASDRTLPDLELVIYGGSAISPSRLDEALRRFGPIFMQIYSQSEAPNFACAMRRGEHVAGDLARLASCGRPLAGITVRLLDEDGVPVRQGEIGEICFRGPSIMQHYWKRPGESSEALKDGWLHTGDLAHQDEAGFIYIVDRRKDMIVSGGFNVYPREIEDVLTAHEAVLAAAVIGIPDPKWGEAVKAIVVRRPGGIVTGQALTDLVKQKKGSVAAPKSVDFVDELPLTPLGKPDKKVLRERYWQGQSRRVG